MAFKIFGISSLWGQAAARDRLIDRLAAASARHFSNGVPYESVEYFALKLLNEHGNDDKIVEPLLEAVVLPPPNGYRLAHKICLATAALRQTAPSPALEKLEPDMAATWALQVNTSGTRAQKSSALIAGLRDKNSSTAMREAACRMLLANANADIAQGTSEAMTILKDLEEAGKHARDNDLRLNIGNSLHTLIAARPGSLHEIDIHAAQLLAAKLGVNNAELLPIHGTGMSATHRSYV